MARRYFKFETLAHFKVGSVGKTQRMCMLVEGHYYFLSEGRCIQKLNSKFNFEIPGLYSRSTKSECWKMRPDHENLNSFMYVYF